VIPLVADADTLFGATTRGRLIHLDCQGLIRLHWSPLILDELRHRPQARPRVGASARTTHAGIIEKFGVAQGRVISRLPLQPALPSSASHPGTGSALH
jgi:hypothetical protein